MLWRIIGFSVLALSSALGAGEKKPGTYAVKAAWIYTLSLDPALPAVIEDGVLLVKDGKIAAVGERLDLPSGIPVIDYGDEVLVPGLVMADSTFVRFLGGRETVSAKYRALDGFDPHADRSIALSGGVTTVYLNPGTNRLLSGVGAVVKTADGQVVKDGGDLCINLGVRAHNPPPLQEYPLPASSANTIPPSVPQRPHSRLSQYLEIEETFEKARSLDPATYDYNLEILGRALAGKPTLRVDARRAGDLLGAIRMIKSLGFTAYLTGALEAHDVLDLLKASGLPVVLEVPVSLGRPAKDIGFTQDPIDARLSTAADLASRGIPFALTLPPTESAEDLLLAAAAAVRGGLGSMDALVALTRAPAEILGVESRVGTLTPGKDADFVVLSGKPFEAHTHVLEVYASGMERFAYPCKGDRLVIRAGCVYTAAGPALRPGEVLIENGKIQAVGATVPHPPGTRFVDAGDHAVVTPGFIDGHGHQGLEGDGTAPGTDLDPAMTVGPAYPLDLEVARAGVTTVVLAPRAASSKGSRLTAVKTAGDTRAVRVVDDLAGIQFSFRGKDPVLGKGALQSALKAGKKYDESWKKYYEALKKWEEEQVKKAEEVKEAPKEEKKPEKKEDTPEEVTEEEETDPITGTWEYTVAGDPLPEPQAGTFKLRLEGTKISGTGTTMFRGEQEVEVEGTLNGKAVHLEINVDIPVGKPMVDAELDRDDHMTGELKLAQYLQLQFEANRTEKDAPKIKVSLRKKKGKDGRPEPPKVNAALEPYRRLLAGEVPALVEVGTAREIEVVLDIFVKEFKLPLGLLGAEEAYKVAARLHEAKVPVVVHSSVLAKRERRTVVPADELSRGGVEVILQSSAEDGARTLPLNAAYAVYKGFSAEEALKALTIHPARLYRINDRVGSLEKGKDGDLIIFDGDPFGIGSPVKRVFISGKEVKP